MQAARGASLSPSDQPEPARRSDPARTHRHYLAIFACVALLGYAADTITKILAVRHLTPGVPVRVVGDLFTFFIARNPGAAFSTGTSFTLLFTLVAIAAAVGVLWVSRRLASLGWALGLGFLLAGIVGNLTDRVFREPSPLHGNVVDFLRFPHFPVFNVADVCINIAAVLVIVQAARGVGVNGVRHHDPSSDRTDPETSAR
jgi:signal peptidase II